MTKANVLKTINSNPEAAFGALSSLYHNRAYIVYTASSNSVRIEKYCKTKRGAEGYIEKQQGVSWYDDYIQEMVSAGSGLEYIEIKDHEIVDPTTDKKIWYDYLKGMFSKSWMLDNVLCVAKRIIIDVELLQWVQFMINDIKESNSFLNIQEFEEEQVQEEVEETKKLKLIQEGVEIIKEAGRINTNDFEDIILKLESYGMNFVDAQNVITENYLYQIEKEEAEETKENNNLNIEISFNEEKNGIEIKFHGKPESKILANLKANGFRWSKYQKIWYAKDTEERRSFVEQFANGIITESEPKIFEYPEININDLEEYIIDSDLSRRENEGNWVLRTKERNHTEEIQSILGKYQDKAVNLLVKTDDKEMIYNLKRDLQRFKKAYHINYTAIISNKANNPSWAVTGRAGRNRSKDQKADNRYNNLMLKSMELTKEFERLLDRYSNKVYKNNRKIKEAI